MNKLLNVILWHNYDKTVTKLPISDKCKLIYVIKMKHTFKFVENYFYSSY